MTVPARADSPSLTPRQLEVLELMAKGLQNREIASALGISPATVKRHVSAVIGALDVTNRTEAAVALGELGLAGPRGASSPEHRVEGFGERPAIAVLAFDDLSDDPEQEFLADGLVEDLITKLARWRWFPVIARNSSFAFRGRAVDVKEASRTLGARYVVEGSLRRAGERVRITVQLIDGDTGKHLWADRYDRDLAELFSLEDEIVDTLVATLEPALLQIEGMRVLGRAPQDLGAWECIQRGFCHLLEFTWEGVLAARPLAERALALDPELALAYTGQALLESHALLYQRSPDPAATAERVVELSRKAQSLDPGDALAYITEGSGWIFCGDPQTAVHTIERGIERNPSMAWGYFSLGAALCALPGRAADAAAALEKAMRISPQDALLPYILNMRAAANMQLDLWHEAYDCCMASMRIAPDQPFAYPNRALCYVVSGQIDEARADLARMREIDPEYSPLWIARFLSPDRGVSAAAALAVAGWQEEGRQE